MRKQKMIRWIAWAVAGIACVAGGIHVYQKYQEREEAIRAIEARDQAKSQEEEDLANGILTWNGKKYRRNTAMRAILCMGVDTKGEMEAQNVAGKGGDADALFLVAQDAAKDEAQIVLIPRNTMTEIEVFDYFGNPIGTETKQLTLTRLVDGIQEKAITNMAKDQYMDMGLAMLNSPKTMEDGDFIELSGEIYQGKFEEFYPDMDELKEIVINLFYKEKA